MRNLGIYREFFKPTLIGIACLLVFGVYGSRRAAVPAAGKDYQQMLNRIGELTTPAPSYSPADVVRIQLAGLSDAQDSLGIMQCMAFASPANRTVTGPLERFGQMVRRPPYAALSQADGVLVGAPTVMLGRARVLVSVLADDSLHSFVWVLSKQKEGPLRDCWLTDAVFFVFTSKGLAPAGPAMSNVPGSNVPGSNVPGSNVPGSNVPVSNLPGSKLPGFKRLGPKLPGPKVPDSTISAITT